jgi:hypothetical protein
MSPAFIPEPPFRPWLGRAPWKRNPLFPTPRKTARSGSGCGCRGLRRAKTVTFKRSLIRGRKSFHLVDSTGSRRRNEPEPSPSGPRRCAPRQAAGGSVFAPPGSLTSRHPSVSLKRAGLSQGEGVRMGTDVSAPRAARDNFNAPSLSGQQRDHAGRCGSF